MSEGKRRKKRNRRSLRVPVDEVPRPTEGDAVVEAKAEAHVLEEGSSTVEMPAFDDISGRATLEELERKPPEESTETEITTDIEEPEVEPDSEVAIDESLLGTPRDGDDDQPLPGETTELVELPDEPTGTAEPAHSVEISVDDDEEPESSGIEEERSAEASADEEEAHDPDDEDVEGEGGEHEDTDEGGEDEDRDEDDREESEAPSRADPVQTASMVIVQRVVQVAGSVGAPPPPEEVRDTVVGAKIDVDDLDDEPDLLVEDAEGDDLEDLDVDLDEPEADPDTVELAVQDADDLLEADEDAEALLVDDDEDEGARRKPPSKPPPPPAKPATGAAAAAPPPPPADAEPKAAPAAPRAAPTARKAAPAAPKAAPKRKKSRRQWWETLFNDDYLRTVPIPQPKDVQRECDFIEQRFGLAKGATILDVGCGLGLHAVELTRRGYLVVGLDLSLPMLSRAADEAQDHGFKINFLHADMREMNFDGAFDAVVCWGTTFGYFDDDANKGVVERLYRALKPRGLLLLDVVNRDYVIAGQPNLVWFEGDGCVVMEETKMNFITSRLEVKRTVILDDGRQRDTRYTLRLYSLHELGQVLHHRGFRVVELSGRLAHPGVYFGADSPKLIVLAERRPQGPPQGPPRAPLKSDTPPPGETSAPKDVEAAPVPAAFEEVEELEEVEEVEDVEMVSVVPESLTVPPSDAVEAALAEAIEQSEEELHTEELEPEQSELELEEAEPEAEELEAEPHPEIAEGEAGSDEAEPDDAGSEEPKAEEPEPENAGPDADEDDAGTAEESDEES